MNVLLETRGLEIRFGGVVAANDVNIAIHEGRNLAIIGPNGAGKTTFLNICTGYLKPSSGSVHFAGTDVTAKSPRQITRMGVARAFQIPQLFAGHTALDNLLIAAAAREKRWAPFTRLGVIPEKAEMMHLLDMVNCSHVADRPVEELPEGQRKLIDIAVALALKPKLLFMDEPTSGVAAAENSACSTSSPGRWPRRRSRQSSWNTTWASWNGSPMRSPSGTAERFCIAVRRTTCCRIPR